MATIKTLSPAKCILLAASLAAESNIKALYQLTPARRDVFHATLILRILLTFLPETANPADYITYSKEVATNVYLEQQEEVDVDASAVDKLSETEAETRLHKIKLLTLDDASVAGNGIKDPLLLFLISRAHTIDAQTGLLSLLPTLLEPFLEKSAYLWTWYVSAVLPLIRLDFEYYPNQGPTTSLTDCETLSDEKGVAKLLSKTEKSAQDGTATPETLSRDFRSVLGPWIQGSIQRKRRRLNQDAASPTSTVGQTEEHSYTNRVKKPDHADSIESWQPVFKWIVTRAIDDFKTTVHIIESWDGPSDLDLGEFRGGRHQYKTDDVLADALLKQYCQSAFASIYANEEDTAEVIDLAHRVLVRLAGLLHFEPPPDLATSIHLLPKIQHHSSDLESASPDYLRYDVLLELNNPLTKPILETFSLLQMLVYSAYQFKGLGHNMPVTKLAKLRFFSDDTEQLKLIQRILHGLVHGPKKDEDQWSYFRDTMLWLWDWAIEDQPENEKEGYGVLGKVRRVVIEKEIIESMCRVGHYRLITKLYLDVTQPGVRRDDIEKLIVDVAFQFFDNASNGNRTRGGAKKASEIIAAFKTSFPDSQAFRRCNALLAAAHALSFYSLTLQRGIPFQPVSIRVNDEPLTLVEKVLSQNPKSYAKLDDLIEIGRNMTIAHLGDSQAKSTPLSVIIQDEATQIRNAERTIIGMAINAALAEDDFETAYSYVVNRLTPPAMSSSTSSTPGSARTATTGDDISWRAALKAGNYRSAHISQISTSSTSTTSPHLRRLEQCMELLSQALLLAPKQALPEVLAAWRRCEENLLAVLAAESEAAQDFDARADVTETRPIQVPGTFGAGPGIEPIFTVQPKRKEMGRGALEEAPMGLFDVARGAAVALGRSAGGLAGKARAQEEQRQQGLGSLSSEQQLHVPASSGADGDGHGRVRKRDMVANAVTGGLVSGIGWMLGATPADDRRNSGS